MGHILGAIVLFAISWFLWFEVTKDVTEDSARGFVKIFKAVFGIKGFIITAKVLAVFSGLSGIAELYKFVMSIL